MSVFGRLQYSPGSAIFNGANTLTQNTINYLNNTNINLNQWQINDLANSSVGGYFKNPHQTNITSLSTNLNAMVPLANTANVVYANTSTLANTLSADLTLAISALSNFLTHTNNISGLTYSSNTSLYPDLNSALAVGRQMLNITNKTDSIQNNAPMIGSFTSLYIGTQLTSLTANIANDYITLNNSVGANSSGNLVSNISNSALNLIISDVSTLQTLMDTQRSGDWTFYQNSMSVLQDYMVVSQFSQMGSTQNSLIQLIGTSKLHGELGY